ncbi:MAG TPA: hypothetical protein PLR35_06690, partial [Burkholderiaceae bacterium]|nr:hypothetical protein [Burkholderiaceae bacterium]
MFTGLVQGVARIEHVERLAADGGVRLTLDARDVPGFTAEVGDSIALNVSCMTATQVDGFRFTGDRAHPDLSGEFQRSIARVEALPCDLMLSTHPGASGLF